MSLKRQAVTELNYDNKDKEDSNEPEEIGTFKLAPKEVVEKRIIRTAKRRSQLSSDEPKKSVFSGFEGFNKAQAPSFDFLANLTNGNKSNTDQATTKTDSTAMSSSIFTNKSLSSSPSSGIFSMSGYSGFATKPTLGKSPEGPFGSTSSNTPVPSVFTASKADSTVNDSPFKVQPSPTTGASNLAVKPNANPDVSQVSSTIFGVPSNSKSNKPLFSASTNNSTLFTTQPVSSTSAMPTNNTANSKVDSNDAETGSSYDVDEERKRRYHSKLRALNESVSKWISKHVSESQLCILSPIFRDYERYLREIQIQYKGGYGAVAKTVENKVEMKPPAKIPNNTVSSSIFGNLSSSKNEPSKNNTCGIKTTSSTLGFASNTSTVTTTTSANVGFSFGIKPSPTSTVSSLFPPNTTTNTNASVPFSFGINKSGFSLNATLPSKTEAAQPDSKEDDDEPPKVEYTPVVEENSVFDIKCKIFIKKDGNFVDKGVGTLYIKKIEESGKHQLLVRANTNLGTVLLNLVLSSSIPAQRMGKNNVMLVCIPTPDTKPPPTPILIRVKTSEEADELLTTLNKYKS